MKNSESPVYPQSQDWQKDMETHINTKGKTGSPSLQGIGLTKKEYFAGLAMQGILSNIVFTEKYTKPEEIIKGSLHYADELLKQLEV